MPRPNNQHKQKKKHKQKRQHERVILEELSRLLMSFSSGMPLDYQSRNQAQKWLDAFERHDTRLGAFERHDTRLGAFERHDTAVFVNGFPVTVSPATEPKAANAMSATALQKPAVASSFLARCVNFVTSLLARAVGVLFVILGVSIICALSSLACFCFDLGRVWRVARGKSNPSAVGWVPFLLLMPVKLLSVPLRVLAFAVAPVIAMVVAIRKEGVRGLFKDILGAQTWRSKIYLLLTAVMHIMIKIIDTLVIIPNVAFSAMCSVWNSQAFIDVWLHHKLGGSRLEVRPTCDVPEGICLIQGRLSFFPGYEKWFFPVITIPASTFESVPDVEDLVTEDRVSDFLTLLTKLELEFGSKSEQNDMTQTPSLYRLLRISKADKSASILSKYRKAMFSHHPDRTGGEPTSDYRSYRVAGDVLGDPYRRCLYDAFGDQSLKILGVPDDVREHISVLSKSEKEVQAELGAISACSFKTQPRSVGSSRIASTYSSQTQALLTLR